MIEAPPSRYRVIERGRRLVVIDTLTGEPATQPAAPSTAARPVPSARPGQIAFDGRSTIVTRAFYDDKAPRTLTLGPGTAARLEKLRNGVLAVALAAVFITIFMPWLLVFAVVPAAMLANGRTRAALRAGVTRWLDRYDASSSAG